MLLYTVNGVLLLSNVSYSGQTILDYISGNDLNGYNIEELEDNPEFMATVMELTRDKEMYYSCSDNVKKDINFVKRIITKFKSDYEFIIKIADQYTNDRDIDVIKKEEIDILMGIIFDETDNFDLMKYKIAAGILYEQVKLEIKAILSTLEEKEQKLLGKGFYFIEECYMGSSLITDYLANNMITEILFDDSEYGLEELLHMYFRKKEDLEKFGETNFLITYIGSIDPFLGDYISRNPSLISDIKKSMDIIKRRWPDYINRINRERVEMIWDEMYRYLEENIPFYETDYEKCLGEIAEKLGIMDIFEKFSKTDADLFGDDIENQHPIPDETAILGFEEPKDCLIMEKNRFVNHMTSYIQSLFEHDVIKDPNDLEDNQDENNTINEKNDRCQIISVNFNTGEVIKKL